MSRSKYDEYSKIAYLDDDLWNRHWIEITGATDNNEEIKKINERQGKEIVEVIKSRLWERCCGIKKGLKYPY